MTPDWALANLRLCVQQPTCEQFAVCTTGDTGDDW
jgi:hypothetical protein